MSLYGLRPLIDSIMGSGSTAYVPWGHITGTLSAQTDLAAALAGKVPITRTITINGTTLDLAADRSWSVGTITGTVANNRLVYGTGTSSLGAVTAIPAGYVMYADSNGLPTFDSSNFFYDSTGHTLILGSSVNVSTSGVYGALYVPTTVPAKTSLGLVMLGGGTFGSGGTFAGIAGGTALAINLTAASKDFFNGQVNGTKTINITGSGQILIGDTNGTGVWSIVQGAGGYIFHGSGTGQDAVTIKQGSSNLITGYMGSTGQLFLGDSLAGLLSLPMRIGILVAPGASANYAMISLGSKPFDGTTSGYFTGGNNGTFLGINAANSNPNFYDFQIAGVSYMLGNSSALTLQTNLKLGTAGNGIYIKTAGGNCTAGQGTLVAGQVVVNTNKISLNSLVFLTDAGGGVIANIGSLWYDTLVLNTSFTVHSNNPLDTSTFNWLIIEPA